MIWFNCSINNSKQFIGVRVSHLEIDNGLHTEQVALVLHFWVTSSVDLELDFDELYSLLASWITWVLVIIIIMY